MHLKVEIAIQTTVISKSQKGTRHGEDVLGDFFLNKAL